jgi:hypothetical protein
MTTTALVALLTASSALLMWRISPDSSAISAIPPALSAMGPKESMATTMPAMVSSAVATTAAS